jgi:hypothetical protein
VTSTFPDQLRPAEIVGYSTQTRLILQLRASFPNSTFYVWFSTELHPQDVDHSSSPLRIFEDLAQAVAVRSLRHPKIRDLRIKYLQAVDKLVVDPTASATLKRTVARARPREFQPVVLKLFLDGFDLDYHRRKAIRAGGLRGMLRNEYLAEDFPESRVAVIVD